jgi:hypothetical protein
MPAFLCTYHVRTTFQKVICQKVTAANKSSACMKAIDKDLAAIMYNKDGDTQEESLAAAKMAAEFCVKWQGEAAIVAHFRTFWLPKLSALRLHLCVLILLWVYGWYR